MPSYRYPQLNDKDWLYQKYFINKLSTNDIRDIVGCKTSNSVRQSLIRFGFQTRNQREGVTLNRNNDGFIFNESVINGCLLGDAGLKCWDKTSENSYAHFYKKNKYIDHIEFVGSYLFDDFTKHIRIARDRNNIYYKLVSATSKELKDLYNKWYPENNNYKKLVPRDINIDSTVLLHWYLDDGYSYHRVRKNQNKKQIVSGLCTQSFNKEDQEFLIEKIYNKFNIKFSLHDIKKRKNPGTGYMLILPQSQFDDFLNILGDPPVKSLSYKWK